MARYRNLISLVIITTVVVTTFLVAHYRKAVPDLGELNQVTELPEDVKDVLSWPVPKSIRIPILMYHYVEYVTDKRDTIRQSLDILPGTFTAQIDTLKKAGFTFITPVDLALSLTGVMELPAKPVILSFDDGYRDFYTDVFPIIKKENVRVVAYLVPGFLDRPNYMFTSQVKEIASSGLVEIGAHTMHHVWLKGLNTAQASYEINESRKALRRLTGQPVNSFAYPYGAFDKKTAGLVEKAGFMDAVSTVRGVDQSRENEYFWFRVRPGSLTGEALVNLLTKTKFAALY